MANYVYNRVFCNKKLSDQLMDNPCDLISGYDKSIERIHDDLYIVCFETHGMNYHTEEIVHIIEKYKTTKWYCIEENYLEQGHLYWDEYSNSVKCDIRKLNTFDKDCIFFYLFMDNSGYRYYYSLSLKNDGTLIFDNYHGNKIIKWKMSYPSVKIINSLLEEKLTRSYFVKSHLANSWPLKSTDIEQFWFQIGRESFCYESAEENSFNEISELDDDIQDIEEIKKEINKLFESEHISIRFVDHDKAIINESKSLFYSDMDEIVSIHIGDKVSIVSMDIVGSIIAVVEKDIYVEDEQGKVYKCKISDLKKIERQ